MKRITTSSHVISVSVSLGLEGLNRGIKIVADLYAGVWLLFFSGYCQYFRGTSFIVHITSENIPNRSENNPILLIEVLDL